MRRDGFKRVRARRLETAHQSYSLDASHCSRRFSLPTTVGKGCGLTTHVRATQAPTYHGPCACGGTAACGHAHGAA